MTDLAVSSTFHSRFLSILRCTAIPAAAIRRVLELGCGDQLEAAGYAPGARLVGIDIDLTALRRVRTAPSSGTMSLVQADITRLPLTPESAQFDLIVARHPDVDRHPSNWQQALTAAPGGLAAGGRLILTCYAPHEAEALRRWAALTPLIEMPVDERQLVPPDLSGRDRFALVYRKGNRSAVN